MRWPPPRASSLFFLVFVTGACSVSSPSPGPLDAAGLAVEIAFCRVQINRYRAMAGRTPLAPSLPLEDFAARAAEVDGSAHTAHHFFAMTNGGGVAVAETEILWWRLPSVRKVIEQGLAQMWQAGPEGHHYRVLAGSYTEVGCGVFVNGGEVTVTQEFR